MKFTSDRQRRAVFSKIDNRFAEKIYHVGRRGEHVNIEDLARRSLGRDSGYLGTGLYGYRTKAPIKYDEDVVVDELELKKPLIVTGDKWKTWNFHEDIKRVHQGAFNPENSESHFGWSPRELSKTLKDLGVDVPEEEIREEFLKDARIIENEPWSKKMGEEQAISRILKKRGYDGIILDSELGDHCGFGCVKFITEDNELVKRIIKEGRHKEVDSGGMEFIPIEVD